jgi:uncharacterized membrane protein (DUF485 family)
VKSNSLPPASRPIASGVSRNARLGLVLFFIYLALYVGFILFSAFAKETMAKPTLHGVNFAIVYGFALIIGALVLALIYMVLCVSEKVDVPDLTEGKLAEEAQKEEGEA